MVVFVVFLGFVYLAMYVFVACSKQFTGLKEKSQLKRWLYVNMGLKLCILLLLVQPFVLFIKDGYHYVAEFFFMTQNKERIVDQLYISGDYLSMSDFATWDIYQSINKKMEDMGAIYQNFSDYEMQMDDEEIVPYIRVNEAYLKDYLLYTVDGERIDLKTIQEPVVFLPETRYPDGEIPYRYYSGIDAELPLIRIRSGTTFINGRIEQTIRSLKDPLIIYYPHVEAMISFGGQDGLYLPIKDTGKEQELLVYLKELHVEELMVFGNSTNDYEVMYEKNKDEPLTFLLLLITYSIVIVSFIYQNTYVYFIENKQKFALKYLCGNHFLQRHGDMLFYDLIVYAPLMPCLYIFYQIEVPEIILFVILAVSFELFASWLLIRLFEKNKMIEILKGE